jgi:hypothetical protein
MKFVRARIKFYGRLVWNRHRVFCNSDLSATVQPAGAAPQAALQATLAKYCLTCES